MYWIIKTPGKIIYSALNLGILRIYQYKGIISCISFFAQFISELLSRYKVILVTLWMLKNTTDFTHVQLVKRRAVMNINQLQNYVSQEGEYVLFTVTNLGGNYNYTDLFNVEDIRFRQSRIKCKCH